MPLVRFSCSCGDFDVEILPEWAPLGAARFMELVEQAVLDQARLFRVVTKPRPFIIQFGIAADPNVSAQWRDNNIDDDPVATGNAEGTLTFATAGPGTRTSQLFINLADNSFLDGQGFSPIGKVVSGMDTVRAICATYGESPDQGLVQQKGNAYLEDKFPELDFIKSISIVEE